MSSGGVEQVTVKNVILKCCYIIGFFVIFYPYWLIIKYKSYLLHYYHSETHFPKGFHNYRTYVKTGSKLSENCSVKKKKMLYIYFFNSLCFQTPPCCSSWLQEVANTFKCVEYLLPHHVLWSLLLADTRLSMK